MKAVFEYVVEKEQLKSEDSGMALVLELDDAVMEQGSDGCMFPRIQSWDEDKRHFALRSLVGRHIRITIESNDDAL